MRVLLVQAWPALASALTVQQGALSLEFLEPTFALANASLFGGEGLLGPRPRWECYPWSPADVERIRQGVPRQLVRRLNPFLAVRVSSRVYRGPLFRAQPPSPMTPRDSIDRLGARVCAVDGCRPLKACDAPFHTTLLLCRYVRGTLTTRGPTATTHNSGAAARAHAARCWFVRAP
jgi:hypothetical protein